MMQDRKHITSFTLSTTAIQMLNRYAQKLHMKRSTLVNSLILSQQALEYVDECINEEDVT